MKRLFLSTIALLTLAGAAQADVVLDNKLSGTGDNVIFNALLPSLVVGSFNGQHTGLADFSCLAGCGGFTGAQSGNDLKINNFQTLKVQVFAPDATTVLPTATDVFSITGTGDVTIFATTNESDGTQKLFTFDTLALFGPLGPGQNGFTLTAINNENIDSFRIVDVGGTITDFEHYRIDIAGPLAPAVPELSTWGMMLLGFAGVGLFGMRQRRGFRFA